MQQYRVRERQPPKMFKRKRYPSKFRIKSIYYKRFITSVFLLFNKLKNLKMKARSLAPSKISFSTKANQGPYKQKNSKRSINVNMYITKKLLNKSKFKDATVGSIKQPKAATLIATYLKHIPKIKTLRKLKARFKKEKKTKILKQIIKPTMITQKRMLQTKIRNLETKVKKKEPKKISRTTYNINKKKTQGRVNNKKIHKSIFKVKKSSRKSVILRRQLRANILLPILLNVWRHKSKGKISVAVLNLVFGHLFLAFLGIKQSPFKNAITAKQSSNKQLLKLSYGHVKMLFMQYKLITNYRNYPRRKGRRRFAKRFIKRIKKFNRRLVIYENKVRRQSKIQPEAQQSSEKRKKVKDIQALLAKVAKKLKKFVFHTQSMQQHEKSKKQYKKLQKRHDKLKAQWDLLNSKILKQQAEEHDLLRSKNRLTKLKSLSRTKVTLQDIINRKKGLCMIKHCQGLRRVNILIRRVGRNNMLANTFFKLGVKNLWKQSDTKKIYAHFFNNINGITYNLFYTMYNLSLTYNFFSRLRTIFYQAHKLTVQTYYTFLLGQGSLINISLGRLFQKFVYSLPKYWLSGYCLFQL